jgi:hypothetical protein
MEFSHMLEKLTWGNSSLVQAVGIKLKCIKNFFPKNLEITKILYIFAKVKKET